MLHADGHQDGQHPPMPSRATSPAGEAQAVAPAPRSTVEVLAGQLQSLQESGSLDILLEMAATLKALADSLTPGVVVRLASLAGRLGAVADEVAREGDRIVPLFVRSASRAAAELASSPSRGPGLRELVRVAQQPDTRRGLLFLLALAREIGRELGMRSA